MAKWPADSQYGIPEFASPLAGFFLGKRTFVGGPEFTSSARLLNRQLVASYQFWDFKSCYVLCALFVFNYMCLFL